MWRAVRNGEREIVVGARSALFAPVANLGLVCVDEEHDTSFKQEEGVRYHARDMALLRARRANAICVLGSATPSLNSLALVERGRLARLRLPERAQEHAKLPHVEVVNLRQQGPGPTGHRLISLPLFRALAQVLEAKRQAILFLNRRGFAPSLICESCGTIVECPNCSVALTVHRARGGRMRCHYCDFESALAVECAKCQSRALAQEGVGTEGIEQALIEAFPEARIGRLDRDVAPGVKSERVLDRMRNRELDVLVGTQMVTKGHDLPDVALVGVLNADAALSLPDYQAAERTFQLLVQVAGRAGRGDTPGKVLIQTRNPTHPAIQYALQHDVESFARAELFERRDANYPPYARMLMVRIDGLDVASAQRCAEQLAEVARRVCGARAEVVGPSPAPLERLRNRYRFRFFLRAQNRAPLFEVARAIHATPVDRRVRVHVDVDPVNML
jgi:primosomal protein N' (replication factor Y)